MAKKKSKKARKRQQQKLMNAPVSQMVQRASDFLAANNPREAINILKIALKKGGAEKQANTLLFQAYHQREAQLRDKGMHHEADVVHSLALDLEPDYSHFAESDLLKIIEKADLDNAVDHYVSYLRKNKLSANIELFLAGLLCIEQDFRSINALDDDIPLKRDAALIQESMTLMNQGEWEQAFDQLKSLPRSSPYAPIKLFCRAICCFYNHDDKGMQRALEMIPDQSALKPKAQTLARFSDRIPCLWDEKLLVKQQIRTLYESLEKRSAFKARKTITDLARMLFPRNQEQGLIKMLELLIPMVITESLPDYFFDDLLEKVIPTDLQPLIKYKCQYFLLDNPVEDTNNYLAVLKMEFPDADQRAIAHSLILLDTVKILHEGKRSVKGHNLPYNEKRALLGVTKFKPDQFKIDMILEAIRLDPQNQDATELLADLPRNSRVAKTKVEQGLTMLVEAHPDDPRPCLELATLFYEKNAFRKAENILAEALKRAPHDQRVTARHVIALLISANKNLQRERFHLTQKDLEKAAQLTEPSTQNLVIEKQIFYRLHNPGQLSLFNNTPSHTAKQIRTIITDATGELPPADQLRILGLLLLDIENNPIPQKTKIQKHLKTIFKKQASLLNRLTSREICRLLAPPGKEVRPLYKSLNIADIFIKRKKDIIRRVDDDDVIPVIDILIQNGDYQLAKKDLRRRMKQKKSKQLELFDFYLAFLEHKLDRNLRDGELFEIIIEDVDKATEEMLRGVARRLAKYADGRLKEALERFDFEILDDFSPFGFDFYEPDDDDYDDDDEIIQGFLGGGKNLPFGGDVRPWMVIELFEMMIDSLELRGASKRVMKIRLGVLKQDKKMMEIFNDLAEKLNEGMAEHLSPEARMFLSML